MSLEEKAQTLKEREVWAKTHAVTFPIWMTKEDIEAKWVRVEVAQELQKRLEKKATQYS